jgi:hypothetical protein
MYLLDIYDNYILAFQKVETSNIIKTAIELYSAFDINVTCTQLEFEVSFEVKEYIKSICGQIIPISNKKININDIDLSISEKLIIDLKKIIDFYRINKFWTTYINPEITVFTTVKDSEYSTCNYSSADNYDKILDKFVANDIKFYVLFNTIFQISVVVPYSSYIEEFCEEFKEFEIVKSFTNCDQTALEPLFHKKSFNKVELVKKLELLSKLYEDNDDTLPEKTMIFKYLKDKFIITNDVNLKMNASELYNKIINDLLIPFKEVPAFKKRLIGYFVEAGLTKKRYSEGYFYYGIIIKKSLPFKF